MQVCVYIVHVYANSNSNRYSNSNSNSNSIILIVIVIVIVIAVEIVLFEILLPDCPAAFGAAHPKKRLRKSVLERDAEPGKSGTHD